MYFCAACTVKNCAKRIGEETEYPNNCPSTKPEVASLMALYSDPEDRFLAQKSALCSPDHSECRILKSIRFAQECGFRKLGLAFCVNVRNQAREIDKIFRDAGFQVESICCKIGHQDRTVIGAPPSCYIMCNPIAQAELFNAAGTELNVVLGLCVGHDTLFIKHSNAPVTVLAAKDHVYDHAPLAYLEHLPS